MINRWVKIRVENVLPDLYSLHCHKKMLLALAGNSLLVTLLPKVDMS